MTRRLALLLIILAAVIGACEDPFVDPFVNDDRWFTVWGWIDPDAPFQEVRVIPVTRTSPVITGTDDRNAEINARVFSLNRRTGVETEWQHRLRQLDDGTFGHVFRSDEFVRPGDSLRLEVRRSDGPVTWAETVVPAPAPLDLADVGLVYEDTDGHLKQDILLRRVERPWTIRVLYRVEGDLLGKWYAPVEYRQSGRPDGNGNWIFTVDLTADQAKIRADIRAAVEAGAVPRPEIGEIPAAGLNRMNVGVIELAEGWDLPAGAFDEEIYAFPDVLTNVVNGYGYWGSGARSANQWVVPEEVSRRLGWPVWFPPM